MALSAGARLGPYEVLSIIGSGGMGEVYRAKDTRLERTIAIKVLPGNLSSDPENRKRFDREARSISSLSHPHICAVHDVGHQDGIDFLVMELLEGETLAARLTKGPLPLDQILRFGAEIADAIDHAHRHGIIHRDLKPGNMILTKSGIKLLDFGLAKIAVNRAEVDLLELPTQQQHLTAKGYILGTIQYMSPEQLEGKEVDPRTDIFSFGTVLYEMAAGQKPFNGNSPASIISAILNHTPAPLSTVRPVLPESLDRIVQTCLAKNPDDRWQTAHDVALQLRWITEGTSPTGKATIPRARSKTKMLPWILASLFFLASLILGTTVYRSLSTTAPEPPSSVQRLSIVLPENTALNSLAISPDGQRIAYVINGTTGFSTLWLRSIDSTQAQEIPETEEATLPFWSPDSKSIGFFTEQELKTVTIGSGPPKTLYEGTEIPKGGAWNQFGDILFSPTGGQGLYRISERGGEATPATTLDGSRGEARHTFPQFLPDGRHFFYLVRSNRAESKAVYMGSLDSKDRKLILPASTPVRFVDPGYLLFVRSNKLMVQRFDNNGFELTGNAIPIADNGSSYVSGPDFSVSENNILVYGGGGGGWSTQPIWFDRSGRQSSPFKNYPSALREPGEYSFCDLSSDDKRLLVLSDGVMWMVDLSSGSFTRYAMTDETDAVFSPDGSEVAYAALFGGNDSNLYRRASSGTGKAELLYKPSFPIADLGWSADGRFITFTNFFQLWALPLEGDRIAFQYMRTEGRQESAVLSPDGKWFAYQSYKTGRPEVYVRSFHLEAGGLWAISTNGGEKPIWRRDGKELFYLTLDRKLMATEVQTGETFKPGATRFLFQTHTQPRINTWGIGAGKLYFASSDGQHFLVNTLIDNTTPTEINVVSNWKSLLKK